MALLVSRIANTNSTSTIGNDLFIGRLPNWARTGHFTREGLRRSVGISGLRRRPSPIRSRVCRILKMGLGTVKPSSTDSVPDQYRHSEMFPLQGASGDRFLCSSVRNQ